LQNGKLKGVSVDRKEFEEMLTIYYNIAGWDDQGAPTYAKLAELDLLWAIEPQAQTA
jgi:aldehyde:ferredoxin oxidoreductase